MFNAKDSQQDLEGRVAEDISIAGAEANSGESSQDARPKSPQQVKAYARKFVQALKEKRQNKNPYLHAIHGGQNRGYGNGNINDYESGQRATYHGKIPQQAPSKGKSGKPSE